MLPALRVLGLGGGRGFLSKMTMRTAIDCTHLAEECRELAKQAVKAEDFAHFSEMAETWELLARQRDQSDKLTETLALAAAIANGRQK